MRFKGDSIPAKTLEGPKDAVNHCHGTILRGQCCYHARDDAFEKRLTLSAAARRISAGNGVSLKTHDR
jgi:hypothetical protein